MSIHPRVDRPQQTVGHGYHLEFLGCPAAFPQRFRGCAASQQTVWFFLRSVRLTLDSARAWIAARTATHRSWLLCARSFARTLARAIFFHFFVFFFFLGFSSSLDSPWLFHEKFLAARCSSVRYDLSCLINHYRKFRQKTASLVRAPDTESVLVRIRFSRRKPERAPFFPISLCGQCSQLCLPCYATGMFP